MKTLTTTIRVNKNLRERLAQTKATFGISRTILIQNILENFLPIDPLPDDFIERCGFDLMVKQNTPIRAILPYTAAMLGYFMDGEFRLKIGSDCVNINPYPEHSILCNIKIIERLYQVLSLNGKL